jgi:O-antigen ligase
MLVMLFGLSIVFLDFILDTLVNSRLDAIGRLITGTTNELDEGSVGTRSTLFDIAMNQFWESPMFGIGLGQFRFNEYNYPHNQHLEIFVELGALVGMLHIGFIAYSFIKSSNINRSIILLFAVGACFSGDTSYLRFLYAFCLLSIITVHTVQGGRKKNVNKIESVISKQLAN